MAWNVRERVWEIEVWAKYTPDNGSFQPHNAYNDGPAFVTQCPIAPGNSYTYDVKIGEQAGTYWYHSYVYSFSDGTGSNKGYILRHLSSQYVDGVRGPLVRCSAFVQGYNS